MRPLAIVLLLVACSAEPPVVRTFHPGEHHIQLIVPEGWEALDQGQQIVLRNGENRLTFIDLGLVDPPTMPLDEIVDNALPVLGHDQRREVKWRRRIRVDGREGMALETWMTLTHEDPRRMLVLVNGGRVLALRCDRCAGATSDAFDRVAESLHFAAGSRK